MYDDGQHRAQSTAHSSSTTTQATHTSTTGQPLLLHARLKILTGGLTPGSEPTQKTSGPVHCGGSTQQPPRVCWCWCWQLVLGSSVHTEQLPLIWDEQDGERAAVGLQPGPRTHGSTVSRLAQLRVHRGESRRCCLPLLNLLKEGQGGRWLLRLLWLRLLCLRGRGF
jgi:hypothetical protein